MAFIYQADCYCDLCGEQIKYDLEVAGKMPENPDDEHSYDSDEYPKCANDDDESDSPQHCGNHEHCFDAHTLPSGRKIGCLIGTNLTDAGIQYVKEVVDEGGELADFWRKEFNYIDFPKNVANLADFDEFLDEATGAVQEMWTDRGGFTMGKNELQSLNNLLTTFFNDKRS